MDDVPYITEEEYRNAHTILLTGGEPVIFTNPSFIAKHIKENYPNVERVYVYANAKELDCYIKCGGELDGIDGLSISIKNESDLKYFENGIRKNKNITKLQSNYVYVFEGLTPAAYDGFTYINREWQ